MRKVLPFIAALIFASYCVAQAKAVVPAEAWRPPETLAATANKACGNPLDGRKYADCFMAQMTKAGAPSGAVAFTREFYKENHGELAILTRVSRNTGKVGLAWVVYPLHKPSNYGLFVVDGDPTFVNTEDLKQLDQKGMEQSFQYQNLKSLFPKVTLFPGNRDGLTWPNVQMGPNGWQFIVGYPLRNGCPTCSDAGHALFAWNFNLDGKFLGTSFMGLTPAPLTSPVSSPQ